MCECSESHLHCLSMVLVASNCICQVFSMVSVALKWS